MSHPATRRPRHSFCPLTPERIALAAGGVAVMRFPVAHHGRAPQHAGDPGSAFKDLGEELAVRPAARRERREERRDLGGGALRDCNIGCVDARVPDGPRTTAGGGGRSRSGSRSPTIQPKTGKRRGAPTATASSLFPITHLQCESTARPPPKRAYVSIINSSTPREGNLLVFR